MSRQTENDPRKGGVLYQCNHCERSERRPFIAAALGGTDAGARTVGYRISSGAPDATVICPECSGVDEDYWDRLGRDIFDSIDWGGA